jgi:multicomponent Na+:H+ antiporter subunit D
MTWFDYYLLLPWVASLYCLVTYKRPKARDIGIITLSIITAILALTHISELYNGELSRHLVTLIPNVSLGLQVEPIGATFALVASGLWPLAQLFAIGYMRGNNEANQSRFYIFYTAAIGTALLIAFAGDLLSLFVFYELMTVLTFPLVAHKGNEAAKNGARTYLAVLMTSSILFFLFVVISVWGIQGSFAFAPEGVLAGKVSPLITMLLYTACILGVGKAALMPVHRWLPAAMVAPTPVSALLHAVAVVKAGVFTVIKVTVYVFGIDWLAETGGNLPILYLASFTLVCASVVALQKQNLKARLAYSTISQLAYVVLAAALVSTGSIAIALYQLVAHAFAKITLFFCAGAIYTSQHKSEIKDLKGLGKAMPFTFAAFAIGAFSIIGLPPFAGLYTKWGLIDLATAEHSWLLIVLLLSTILNVIYLMPIPAMAFFQKSATAPTTMQEAPLLCLVPLLITAGLTTAMFFCAPWVIEYLNQVLRPA